MSIIDDVNKIINDKSYNDDEKIKSFSESIERFNELVKRGLAKPRGNQIMPLDELYRKQIRVNTINKW